MNSHCSYLFDGVSRELQSQNFGLYFPDNLQLYVIFKYGGLKVILLSNESGKTYVGKNIQQQHFFKFKMC